MRKIFLIILAGMCLLTQAKSFSYHDSELPFDWNEKYVDYLGIHYGCPHSYLDATDEYGIFLKKDYDAGFVIIEVAYLPEEYDDFSKFKLFLTGENLNFSETSFDFNDEEKKLILVNGELKQTRHINGFVTIIDGFIYRMTGFSTSPIYAKNYFEKEKEKFKIFINSVKFEEENLSEAEMLLREV